MALDPFRNVSVILPQKSHLLLVERCQADYTVIWLSFLFLYIASVIIAVAVLAFKSSEIRYKNFRDTKATSNSFAFLAIFTTFIGVFYWLFLRSLEQNFSNSKNLLVVLYSTHFTIPLLCQVFLFVPKIYPPIKRLLMKGAVKSKGSWPN